MASVKMNNYFSLEVQLTNLKTGKDTAKIFENEIFLQTIRERQLFKKILGTAGRHDLAVKLERYIVRGKS